MSQANSDPLPYTQVDRAVKPKAALLAGAIGVSPQHAMGSLVEFWDLCGDPRELERLVAEDKHEVLLSSDEVAIRFTLASGRTVDPGLLVALGLLEPREEEYRVRGMSRYFEPVERRLQAREAARKGGLARAAKGARVNGKYSQTASNVAEPLVEVPLKRRSSDLPAAHQPEDQPLATPEPSPEPPQRSEVSGQRASTGEEGPPTPPKEVEPPSIKPNTPATEFYVWAQETRRAAGYCRERAPNLAALGTWFSVAMAEVNGDEERLREAFLVFGDDEFWKPKKFPFNGFIAQWEKYVPQTTR